MRTLFCLLLIYLPGFSYAQILTQTDSIKIDGASIWGGISYDGVSLNITTMAANEIHLYKFDTLLNQKGSKVPLTTSADYQAGSKITDHKHIYLNNTLYINYSTTGDTGLFIFRIDTSGNRIDSLVTVYNKQENPGKPTNDMIFVTDSSYLYSLHFIPGFQHYVHTFDLNLTRIGSPFATSFTLAHNNIGSALFRDSTFFMFTGSNFGGTSNLILTEWGADWGPAAGSPKTLIASTGYDAKWFASAVTFDNKNNRWYIGYQHLDSGMVADDEHIDIAVFDSKFNLLENYHVTNSQYYRPHFLLLHNYLYMIYDRVGGVFIKKYLIEADSTISNIIPSHYTIQNESAIVYFVQLNQEIKVIYKGSELKELNFELYSVNGKLISKSKFRSFASFSFKGTMALYQITEKNGRLIKSGKIAVNE